MCLVDPKAENTMPRRSLVIGSASLCSAFEPQRTQRLEEYRALGHSNPLSFIDPYAYAALHTFFALLRAIRTGKKRSKPAT
jgi:hypothetical protein